MGKLVGETNACNSMRIGRVPSRLATTTEPVAFCGRSDRNQADGLATSLSPASVISNTPISLVEPNRFFTARRIRSEEHTSELQSRLHLVCRLLLEKKKNNNANHYIGSTQQITN